MKFPPEKKSDKATTTPLRFLRLAGFAIGAIMVTFYLYQFVLLDQPLKGLLSGKAAPDRLDWLVIAGAPIAIALFTLGAVFSEAPFGAALLMGCFCAALGIALKAGYRVDYYFKWMAAIILPQALEGALFLIHSRKVFRRPKVKAKRIKL